PKGGALWLPDGREVVRGTEGRSSVAELWRRRKARGRMKPRAKAHGGWRTDDTAGPGRNAEALAGAGNPIPPRSGRRQHSEEHRTFTRGSAGQGDLNGAATGGPGTSEGECAQGGPSGRRARQPPPYSAALRF